MKLMLSPGPKLRTHVGEFLNRLLELKLLELQCGQDNLVIILNTDSDSAESENLHF